MCHLMNKNTNCGHNQKLSDKSSETLDFKGKTARKNF